MSKDVSPGTRRIMDRAWMRDASGIVHEGEALMLAMLLNVKKSGKRTVEQETELQEIIENRGAKNKK